MGNVSVTAIKFSRNVRRELDERKWGNTDLHRASGVSVNMLILILNCKTESSTKIIERIGSAFNKSAAEMLV